MVLAKKGRKVVALDYNKNTVKKVKEVADDLNIPMETVCADATQKLDFKEFAFDYVFQAGLLEHFYQEQRIQMLQLWRPICKNMISLIPNANSVAYRIGKGIAEANGTWKYGLEMPQASLRGEFEQAGYVDIREYTIGSEVALNFLPKDHYFRMALETLMKEGNNLDEYAQGYLLVTIGRNRDYEERA